MFPLLLASTASDSPCHHGDGPVATNSASPRRRGEAGPGTALVTTAQRPKPAELAVRAHRTAASPAVSGSLREQTGGGEEERDERKEERTGGGGVAERGDEGDGGPLVY